ncbi:Uncharacterised protein [Bordetella pertussis]|nr:Uncharacterised protein [Bordetella pertussis]
MLVPIVLEREDDLLEGEHRGKEVGARQAARQPAAWKTRHFNWPWRRRRTRPFLAVRGAAAVRRVARRCACPSGDRHTLPRMSVPMRDRS